MQKKTFWPGQFRVTAAYCLVIIIFSISGSGNIAAAANLNQFIMPGPLSAAHAKYENECSKCHDPLDQKTQRPLCLECHKEVAKDIREKSGFHGREGTVAGVECHNCHTEHAGRDGAIVLIDMDLFNHTKTDFQLKSSHQQVKCGRCHHQGKKFREATPQCSSCHEKQEPHAGKLGKDCQACHQEDSWKNFHFKHDTTKFPLQGSHEKLACGSCHPNQQWKNLSVECRACHLINDIHNGRFGTKCDKCHNASLPPTSAQSTASTQKSGSGWRPTNFDHATTRYPLTDKHRSVSCLACHDKSLPATNDPKETKTIAIPCSTCHQKNDEHRGTFGQKCENCHSPAGWKQATFDHNKTKFQLQGNHQQVACIKCHTGSSPNSKIADSSCEACHRLDDRHKGSFGNKCETCHTPLQWKKTEFDHNKTKFVLQGKHITTPCASCHNRPLSFGKPGHSCENCHLQKDVHQGQQGKQCEKCHNSQGWRENIFFDHDLTAFPLLGMHTAAPCESCHLTTAFGDAPTACKECHAAKDRHQNKLGPSCDTCHNPNGWKIWRFDHDTQTKFRLDGAHAGLDCLACHQDELATTTRRSLTCYDCHLTNDRHRGKFGRSCQRCHKTDTFTNIQMGVGE